MQHILWNTLNINYKYKQKLVQLLTIKCVKLIINYNFVLTPDLLLWAWRPPNNVLWSTDFCSASFKTLGLPENGKPLLS